ncbi:SsrA-binding protein [Entomoplasma freundtii]|uniref:SsrA-binding protein n=1 Tax=Entomoplasma freundtii TaxID=74700 RepID=A0A2K8NV77_9MOLU|nr:SsrA-binding protein SmpB [Entomoplasma freundtii]ATZ16651.1 SsrA-binding protein [Entomoplasma freundtii]TDY58182.1 SsrA-binding protein [Entomoplasma freundtii]
MSGELVIARNKKAFFNYEILETYEAGLVLNGPEIKAIRAKEVSIGEAFILIRHGEAFVHNLHIKNYEYAHHISGLDEVRPRKLLLHKNEIKRLEKDSQQDQLAIIPLRLYLKNNLAKLEIGLGRGKKLYDKRETIKKRDLDRRQKHNKY